MKKVIIQIIIIVLTITSVMYAAIQVSMCWNTPITSIGDFMVRFIPPYAMLFTAVILHIKTKKKWG